MDHSRAETPQVTVPEPELVRRGRTLLQVLALAEALPTRHEPVLRFPRLPAPTPR